MKLKSTWTVALLLGGLGIIDMALRCSFTPHCGDGILAAIHDPGKSLFHIFILPSVVYLLLRYWSKFLPGFPLRNNYIIQAIFTILFIIAFAFTLNNARNNFFHNLTTPEDILDKNIRSELFDFRETLRETLKKNVAQGGKDPETAANDFGSKAEQLLGSGIDSFERYFEMASPRRHVATFLTLFGGIITVIVFGVLVSLPFIKNFHLGQEGRQYILVIIVLLALWFPLKVYSNWYHNFGYYPGEDEALILCSLLLLACVILVYSASTPTVFFEISALMITIISGALTFVAKYEPKYTDPFFSVIANLEYISLSVIYAIIIFGGSAILKSLNEKLSNPNI